MKLKSRWVVYGNAALAFTVLAQSSARADCMLPKFKTAADCEAAAVETETVIGKISHSADSKVVSSKDKEGKETACSGNLYFNAISTSFHFDANFSNGAPLDGCTPLIDNLATDPAFLQYFDPGLNASLMNVPAWNQAFKPTKEAQFQSDVPPDARRNLPANVTGGEEKNPGKGGSGNGGTAGGG